MTSVVARQPTPSRCNSPRPHRQHAHLHTTYIPKVTHHDPIGSGRKGERRNSQGSRKFDQPNEGQLRADQQQPLPWAIHVGRGTRPPPPRATTPTPSHSENATQAFRTSRRTPVDHTYAGRSSRTETSKAAVHTTAASSLRGRIRPTSRRRRQPEKTRHTRHTERSHTTERTCATPTTRSFTQYSTIIRETLIAQHTWGLHEAESHHQPGRQGASCLRSRQHWINPKMAIQAHQEHHAPPLAHTHTQTHHANRA